MKTAKILLAGIALSGLASGTAAAFDLGNCDGFGDACPYATYGDGNSYALALNAFIYDHFQGGGTGPTNPFYVNSSPGQISNLIVNATGSGGNPVTTNFPGMDNAYPTPNGNGGAQFFTMNKTAYGLSASGSNQTVNGITVLAPPDPGGANEFTGDTANTWDTTVSALNSFLGAGNTPIFFFNNNQVNSGASTNQNIAVWAQITLTDSTGQHTAMVFDFTNHGGTYTEPTQGLGSGGVINGDPTAYTSTGAGPNAGTNASTDYVLSGGVLCVDNNTFTPVPSVGGNCPSGSTTINNNLGANQAAYAVVFPELNTALLTGNFDSMSVDLRFGCDPNTDNTLANNCVARNANNGFEQLFIAAAAGIPPPPPLPEPASLALVGIGLLGFAAVSRRRRA